MPSTVAVTTRTSAVRIAEQGFFWVGVTDEDRDGHTVVDGSQLYVKFQARAGESEAARDAGREPESGRCGT